MTARCAVQPDTSEFGFKPMVDPTDKARLDLRRWFLVRVFGPLKRVFRRNHSVYSTIQAHLTQQPLLGPLMRYDARTATEDGL
jgi:hypothetical protein